jgi:DnaJ-class molecular chaperone
VSAGTEEFGTCAFCKGRGVDPFGVLSWMSACEVCAGTGAVHLPAPRVPCVFCGRTGTHPHRRLTCTGCGGRGASTVRLPHVVCGRCAGRGREPAIGPSLPCGACKGAGVVAALSGEDPPGRRSAQSAQAE